MTLNFLLEVTFYSNFPSPLAVTLYHNLAWLFRNLHKCLSIPQFNLILMGSALNFPLFPVFINYITASIENFVWLDLFFNKSCSPQHNVLSTECLRNYIFYLWLDFTRYGSKVNWSAVTQVIHFTSYKQWDAICVSPVHWNLFIIAI